MNYNGLNWDAECQMMPLSLENKITDLTSLDMLICKRNLLQTVNGPTIINLSSHVIVGGTLMLCLENLLRHINLSVLNMLMVSCLCLLYATVLAVLGALFSCLDD